MMGLTAVPGTALGLNIEVAKRLKTDGKCLSRDVLIVLALNYDRKLD